MVKKYSRLVMDLHKPASNAIVANPIDKKINRNIARRNWFMAQPGKPTP
jgi:hypothetical protein